MTSKCLNDLCAWSPILFVDPFCHKRYFVLWFYDFDEMKLKNCVVTSVSWHIEINFNWQSKLKNRKNFKKCRGVNLIIVINYVNHNSVSSRTVEWSFSILGIKSIENMYLRFTVNWHYWRISSALRRGNYYWKCSKRIQ